MKNLLYLLVFLFICFECESQTLYTCANCNCFLKSPCVDQPGANTLCITNTTQINCYDSSIKSCLYGCGVNADGGERCLCPRNCTGHGYCSSGVCNCDYGYFGAYCDQTDFCFGKNDGLHCDPNNSTQMIGCYNQRINDYYYCKNCTYDAVNDRGYCNCPNDCSGNGTCQQTSDALGVCACYGNYIGTNCATEFTACPAQFAVTTCSGKTLVKCSSSGSVQSSIECLSGCTNTTSTTAACSCGTGCGSQGTCIDPGVCKCFNGYTGPTCKETTVCTGLSTSSYVCINSTTVGYCSNYQLTSYTISCPLGCYLGSCICDSTTCINGYCLSTGECNCYSGWNGSRCDVPSTSTPSTPGTPGTSVNTTATFCTGKVLGNYCDGNNLVLCSDGTFYKSTPCQYGCNSTLWGGSHTCNAVKCPPGYFGSACEFSDPCVNGTMSRFTGSQDFCVGNFVVSCNPTNTTSRIFCTNGCTGASVNGRSIATCNCNCGPQGKDCDIYGNCDCNAGWLSCPSGFTGDKCDVATNPCAGYSTNTICQASNSSLLYCYNGVVSSSVKCSKGCAGASGCACANNCSGNGFCGPNGSCFCRAGYVGDDCSQALECTGQPNGFVCDSEGSNLLTCMRDRVLYRSTCAGGCVDGACKCQNDCNGKGTCRQGVCMCNNGYTGDSCDIYLDSDIASVFIIIIAVGLAASVGYALIIYFKTKVETPEVEMETLRAKNRPDRGRLTISRRATTALKLNK